MNAFESSSPQRSQFLTAFALFFGFAVLPAAAQESKAEGAVGTSRIKDIKVVVGGATSLDSNPFRLPESGHPKSDTISSAYVGLRVDKTFSQQRAQLDLTRTTNRYEKSANLNFDALDYRAAWLWQLTSRLNGTLSATRGEKNVPFESRDNTANTARNVSIGENRAFNLNAQVFGDWYVTLGTSRADQKTEQSLRVNPDSRSVSRELGLKYATPLGNSIAFIQRSTKGIYVNQPPAAILVNNGYQQDDSVLSVNWAPRAASVFTSRLSWQNRTNENPAQRNFSGPAVDVSYNWKPAGKLSAAVSASRKLGPLQDPSFSHIRTDTYSLMPTWQVSAITTMRLVLTRTNSSYGGAGPIPPAAPGREETLNSAELRAEWTPLSNLSMSASLQRQQRDANNPLLEYEANVAKLNVTYSF